MEPFAKTMADVMRDKRPRDRRHLMSIFAGTPRLKKSRAEKLLGFVITKDEWWKAGQHALFPGPGEKVPVIKSSRQRFKIETLLEMMGHVDENFLQRVAYGDNEFETAHGNTIQIDAVQTTANAATIARDYHNKFNPKGTTCAENQCVKKHRETNHYCQLPRGHEGRCKFTPKEALSVESLRKFLKTLTVGQQRSFAGLDDEMVYKGTNNVRRLHEIYDLVATEESDEARKEMKERIDHILHWHQSGFRFHLTEEGGKCCQCIPCGIHSDAEPIPCPLNHRHEDACHDCEESFQVISDIKTLIQKAKAREDNTMQQDETYHEVVQELSTCRTNLIEYRAHIVRKRIEGKFQREQIQSLKDNEAIVVCDFKMKINPMYFREAQKDWFGKRGTACCGFLVYTKAEVEGEVNAEYFYFFSDDTCQDANMVMAAKAYIYGEHLPTLFPEGTSIEVKFETDGAGCFNSALLKACQPLWYLWTDKQVEEIQIRHSVNGDGKSCLDGSFAKLGCNFKDRVNEGMDIIDARTCLAAFQSGPGITNAGAVVLQVIRENDLQIIPGSGLPLLLGSHRIVLNRRAEEVTCYTYSGFGNGHTVPFSRLQTMVPDTTPMPRYCVDEGEEESGCKEIVTHSTESNSSRIATKRATTRERKRRKFDEAFKKRIEEAAANGLFICYHRRKDDLAPCRKQFKSMKCLQAHVDRGVHDYQKQSMIATAATLLSGQNGLLAVGRRMNRNEEHYSDKNVKDGKGVGIDDGAEWKEPGCYRKTGRKDPTRKSRRLVKELMALFDAGESDSKEKKSSNKYTPHEALAYLGSLRNPSGMRTFSSTSIYGTLPSISQIKSYWSSYKKVRSHKTEQNIEDIEDFMLDGMVARSSSNTSEVTPLQDLCFYLNGKFDNENLIHSTIRKLGGSVEQSWKKSLVGKCVRKVCFHCHPPHHVLTQIWYLDFIVLGQNPKRKDRNPSTRFTNWDKLLLLSKEEIHMEDLHKIDVPFKLTSAAAKQPKAASKKLKAVSLHSGVLNGIVFILDGVFESRDNVQTTIGELGGKVMGNISKNTSKCRA